MNHNDEQLLPLTGQDIARIKRVYWITNATAGLFALFSLGALILCIKTITDPYFRKSDGYIVFAFLGFIFLIGAGIAFERRKSATRLKQVITGGKKLVIHTSIEELIRTGAGRRIKHELKLTNGRTVKVKTIDTKSFQNFKSLYDLPGKQAIELHIFQPDDIILTIVKK